MDRNTNTNMDMDKPRPRKAMESPPGSIHNKNNNNNNNNHGALEITRGCGSVPGKHHKQRQQQTQRRCPLPATTHKTRETTSSRSTWNRGPRRKAPSLSISRIGSAPWDRATTVRKAKAGASPPRQRQPWVRCRPPRAATQRRHRPIPGRRTRSSRSSAPCGTTGPTRASRSDPWSSSWPWCWTGARPPRRVRVPRSPRRPPISSSASGRSTRPRGTPMRENRPRSWPFCSRPP
mmetsp:Transcript_18327/g.51066  ORF Transcript_18327/g.51066 Transcript_18327/m.51066 type:complete len:234 (-) Transcript_18327:423-1124(-)